MKIPTYCDSLFVYKIMIRKSVKLKFFLNTSLLGLSLFTSIQLGIAQEYNWAPDFPVGVPIIDISAQDQNGALRSFNDLTGERGLLFMLSRSFDW